METIVGVEYAVYSTEGIETWTPLDEPFTGNGETMGIRIATSKSIEFVRIETGSAVWGEFN